MKIHGVWLLSVGLLAGADATDRDKIQGTWKVVAVVENGKDAPAAEVEKVRFRFTADKLLITDGDEKHEAAYKLDPARKPPAIEVTPDDGPHKGEKIPGLYELKGDKLTLCLKVQAGKEAPADFTARADSGRALFTLERVKP